MYLKAMTNEGAPLYSSVHFYLSDENCTKAGYCNPHHQGGSMLLINNIANPFFANGVWHKIEIYYKGSTGTTTKDGILRMWVDNIKMLDYTDMNLNPNTTDVCACNIWDSINTVLPQEEWINYDHLYLSVPGTGSNTNTPSAPTGLKVG